VLLVLHGEQSPCARRWGGWKADALTADILDDAYLEMIDTGLSNRSVQAFHKALKAAYQLAVDRGRLVSNPAALATPPTVSNQARRYWTPEQVGEFLVYAASHPCVVTGLVETMVDSGGRRGEVLGLHWNDIDLNAGTATVAGQLVADSSTKALSIRSTKRPRSKSVIALHPDTVAALRRRKVDQAAERLAMGAGWPSSGIHYGLVFTWPDGRAIHPDVLTRTVARMSTAAGLPRLTPHGLRHSFARAALAARVPVEVVAARLGNTPRVVQETYQHVVPADDAAAARLVGDLYRRVER
jgi:integrase